MHTNPNVSHARHSPPQDRRPSGFALPPEQHLRFPQSLEPAPQAAMPPAQVPPNRMADYMGTGSSSHNVNGWELPANGNGTAMSGSWNQHTSVPSDHHQPDFQAQARRPLSDNPFQQHPPQNHHNPSVSQPTINNLVSDDSLMVDNMFASLGASDGDGGGLLDALNSVSLGAGASQQGQQGNWGSKITGWSGEDSSSILQQSRLGEYREE